MDHCKRGLETPVLTKGLVSESSAQIFLSIF